MTDHWRIAHTAAALAAAALLVCACGGHGALAGEPEPERIAIIGTGNVGSALGERWAAAGHAVTWGTRRPDGEDIAALVERAGHGASAQPLADAIADADVVVLAIPWTAVDEVLDTLGELAGRIVVDPINATRFADGRVTLAHPALAEHIASRVPEARVVKALNTTVAGHMRAPPDTHPVTVPLAGDDPAAVARVARLVTDLGLVAQSVGPLYNARHVEAMGILYIDVNLMHEDIPGLEYRLEPVQR